MNLQFSKVFDYKQFGNFKKNIQNASFKRHYTIKNEIKPKVIISSSTNPYFNLSFEEWLFNNAPPSVSTLFLWRNEPVVVIGKHQNPWKECKIDLMETEGVHLSRRRSGGGAVYQDLGNSNWTFINGRDEFSIEKNIDVVRESLLEFSIPSEFTGRNDIHVQGKKVSGSAFKLSAEKAIHHGTILVDINKENVEKYLTVNKEKLKSKGVESVRQRILNLKEIEHSLNHDNLCEALIKQYSKVYDVNPEIETIDHLGISNIESLKNIIEELQSWEWKFGKSPSFEYNIETRFDWGIMDVNISLTSGRIASIKIYSDSLYPLFIEELERALLNSIYSKDEISKSLASLKENLREDPKLQSFVQEFEDWFIKSI